MKQLLLMVAISVRLATGESVALTAPTATPPMGWNSWNKFHCTISDEVVRRQADAIAANGMREAGYAYVVIDDCWQGERDAAGVLHSNARFPDMKSLADYVHAKGLKFGIYSSPGPKTCAKHEGSYQHEESDARTFAEWGVDYLKYDWCSAGKLYVPAQAPEVFRRMGAALHATGRPIVYSLSNYGMDQIWTWGPSTGAQLWRTTGDIEPRYESILAIGFGQAGLERFAGPGHWNDPDMLEVGNGRLSLDEQRLHFSLWCLLAAPLMAGNDLTAMSPETLVILTNREVIAIDQDRLGAQAHRVYTEGPVEVWAKPLENGALAVGLFNKGESPAKLSVSFRDLGISGNVLVRDLWAHQDRTPQSDGVTALTQSHGVTLLLLSPAR